MKLTSFGYLVLIVWILVGIFIFCNWQTIGFTWECVAICAWLVIGVLVFAK